MSKKHLPLLGLGALTAVAVSVLLFNYLTKTGAFSHAVPEVGAANNVSADVAPNAATVPGKTPRANVNGDSAGDKSSVSPAISRPEFVDQPEARELLTLLDSASIVEFANIVFKETRWTSAKLDAVAQSNLACVSAAGSYSRRFTESEPVVAPVDAYIAHLAALKYFLQTYCKEHAYARGKMQQILDARLQMQDMANLLRKFTAPFDEKLYREFLAYINWEPYPQFAYSMTEQVFRNIKSNRTSRSLVLVPQINGDLVPDELTAVYALAAEIRSCRYSRACDANMPYTMLQCMDRTNCTTGQSLLEFRRQWSSPVVFESAKRLAQFWAIK